MREIRLSGSVEGVVSNHDLLEANAKNLHQTGRAFIMREALLHIGDWRGAWSVGRQLLQPYLRAIPSVSG